MTTVGDTFAIEGDDEKPRVLFVLTREEYEALRPCKPNAKRDWWSESPRLERTTDGRELLVYREGWEEEMARSDAGALVFFGMKKLGGLDEPTARAIIRRVRAADAEAKATAAEPSTMVVEGPPAPFWAR